MSIAVLLLVLIEAQNAGTIEGIAANRITGAGVPNVTVKVSAVAAPMRAVSVVTTDATGAFRIDHVPEGDYVASFDAPRGFMAPSGGDAAYKPFHVAGGGKPVKLHVPIVPLAMLRGRVLDVDRRPVPSVRVELFMATGNGGDISTTDAAGRFSFERILPGAYKLRARPVLPGSPLAQRSKEVSPISANPPEGERWTWAPTYFPNTTDIAGAETIVAREGADLAGYDIHLRSTPVYRLRGLVLDHEGRPAPAVRLSLLSEIGWGTAEAAVTSAPDGTFEFTSVRPGDWNIIAESKRDAVALRGYAQLMMPNQDVEDLRVRVSPPFMLHVLVDGIPHEIAARANVAIGVISAAVSYQMSVLSEQQSDGVLPIDEVYPGRYLIAQYGSIPGYYLHSVLKITPFPDSLQRP
jgi:hypothetical protein